jgi:hypothetical protein
MVGEMELHLYGTPDESIAEAAKALALSVSESSGR